MYKLLIALGVIDLAFSHPLFTSLTLVGVFFYQHLTPEDKEQLMTIYTNASDFTKYLTQKAKELGLTVKELRKQIVEDLDEPEAEERISPNFFENLPDLSEYLSYEELQQFAGNVPLMEKVAAVVKESLHQPELIWHGDNLTLNDYIGDTPEIAAHRKETYEKDFKLKLDYDKPMTAKYFRQISSKFKAVGKNNMNEVIDEDMHNRALRILEEMDYFFKHGKYKPFLWD
jgi:hypothetical protein